jgi:hypothetical protein
MFLTSFDANQRHSMMLIYTTINPDLSILVWHFGLGAHYVFNLLHHIWCQLMQNIQSFHVLHHLCSPMNETGCNSCSSKGLEKIQTHIYIKVATYINKLLIFFHWKLYICACRNSIDYLWNKKKGFAKSPDVP